MKKVDQVICFDKATNSNVTIELHTEKKKGQDVPSWFMKDTRDGSFINKNTPLDRRPTVAEIFKAAGIK